MKKINMKLMGTIVLLIIAMLLPISVFAVDEQVQTEQVQDVQMQIVNKKLTETEDEMTYIIYVKGLLDEEFNYAISEKSGATDLELNYINSKKDQEGNSVILLNEIELNQDNYIYIKKVKDGKEEFVTDSNGQKLNLEESFDASKMELVENTTTRILTIIIEEKETKNENDVKITTTTDGLQIENPEEGATYYYTITKVPDEENTNLEDYRTLYNYILTMNSEEYENMDMYSRIELVKQFYDLYNNLITQQNWLEIQNMKVLQPMDSQDGDKYIIYLKKSGTTEKDEIIDAKFLESHREDEEEKIPEQTQIVETKRTSKLPITGDSLILFAILAVIIIALVIVAIRMKKLKNNGKHS